MSSSEIRAPKKQLSDQPSSLIPSIPDDVIIDILARVRRCNYPNLSVVSKHFRSIVSSDELYARRILLGCTEACIYVVGRNPDYYEDSWYILQRKANGYSLVLIQSIPAMMPYSEGIVSVGSMIYALGGINYDEMTPSALSIDGRTHAVKPLPSLPIPMVGVVADVIDEKIYAIGYCNVMKLAMVVFNTETRMWEPEIEVELDCIGYGIVAMADKIYMRDHFNSFVYRPKESKWEKDWELNLEDWSNACVIDDLLYYYDCFAMELKAYDMKQRLWRVVKGVAELFPKAVYFQSHTVSYGGKLAVFLRVKDRPSKTNKIWCTEIALERRQNGREIWGKVVWSNDVVIGDLRLMKSLVVMV